MNPDLVWMASLNELQLQMTESTFDIWLRGSQLIECADGVFIVGVKSGYAKDWLENRLLDVIQRTVSRMSKQEMAVRFKVVESEGSTEEPERELTRHRGQSFELPDYDVLTAGFFQMAG